MSLLVDTSVWSLAFRRDDRPDLPEIDALAEALRSGDLVVSTGLVLQELLQGFAGPRARDAILERFSAIGLVVPDRRDHVEAAGIRNACRRNGVQAGTVDALLAQLAIRHDLVMLTADADFTHIARHVPLRLWQPGRR